MVCRLTVGKKAFADVKDELSAIRDQADTLRAELTRLIDTDKEAFNKVMAAFKLPKDTQERATAVEAATKGAAEVPLTVMKKSLEVLRLAETAARKGNPHSVSDAGVASLMGLAAVEGAGYNVKINLSSLNDAAFVKRLGGEADNIIKTARETASRIRQHVEASL